jgi:hypothetical protein
MSLNNDIFTLKAQKLLMKMKGSVGKDFYLPLITKVKENI